MLNIIQLCAQNYARMSHNNIPVHINARSVLYPQSSCKRFPVPDGKVSWKVGFKEYTPVNHTAAIVASNPPWADVDVTKSPLNILKYNAIDGKTNRKSFTGVYDVINNVPINPAGRTGVTGRGLLGKWGPNHAADPIVTRWKCNEGVIVKHVKTKLPVLQFVAIQRKDNGEWAIPGGMVDAGERVSVTLKREFGEEALNALDNKADNAKINKLIKELFKSGKTVFEGYVDDPRNTDNAWMETVAVNFHDDNGNSVAKLPLSAGDDAGAVRWMDVGRELMLYASHKQFLKQTAKNLAAHW